MSDLERIAKAVVDELSRLKWDDLPEEGQKLYLDMTKAVLQALAEPSEKMVSVGHAILFGRGADVQPHDFPDAFKAAIQHILDQEPNHG